jgi:hypothetical protein
MVFYIYNLEMRLTFSSGNLASILSESDIIPRYSIIVKGLIVLCLANGTFNLVKIMVSRAIVRFPSYFYGQEILYKERTVTIVGSH